MSKGQLKDFLKTAVQNHDSEYFRNFFNEFNLICSNTDNSKQIYDKYFTGRESIISKINQDLLEKYPVRYRNLQKKKKESFFVYRVYGRSLYSIIREFYGLGKDHKFSKGLIFDKFNPIHFREICKITVAMHLEKYDVASLSLEHVYFIVFMTMWKYYKVCNDDGSWNVQYGVISQIYASILETDMDVYEDISLGFGLSVMRLTETEKRIMAGSCRRPEKIDDVLPYISTDMTQAEKKEAIMDAFCCGSTTARNIMKQFGLTEKKYERSDYAELHAHLDEIDDRIGEAVDEISGSINCVREDISDVRDDIKQGFSNIEQLLMQKYTQNESPAKINQFDLFGL